MRCVRPGPPPIALAVATACAAAAVLRRVWRSLTACAALRAHSLLRCRSLWPFSVVEAVVAASVRTAQALHFVRKATRAILLSGTPMISRPYDIFNQVRQTAVCCVPLRRAHARCVLWHSHCGAPPRCESTAAKADGISIRRHCRSAVSVTLVLSLAFPERRNGLKATSASACALCPDDDRSCGCTADPLRGSARGALQRMGAREYSRRTRFHDVCVRGSAR